jgi:CopG family nickel-responsive transcriptional regulator
MQRATITLDDEFVAELDRMMARRGYQNRSEAIRDLARAGMRQATEDAGVTGNCVAALVYVYDHESRELSKRLTQVFHDHHDLSLSAMHVHLDHGSCMEVAVLKGEAERRTPSRRSRDRGARRPPRPPRHGAGGCGSRKAPARRREELTSICICTCARRDKSTNVIVVIFPQNRSHLSPP